MAGPSLRDVSVDPREQLEQFKLFESIDEQGDGLRSVTAVHLVLQVVRRPIILIDEPEAFLHPPQALALGRELVTHARDRQLIIATHSTDLLRGILSAGSNATVIRLTRTHDRNNANVVNTESLKDIGTDPLLGSERALDGIFYLGAIVTEGDSDRAVYAMAGSQIHAHHDLFYTHSHDKRSIKKLIRAYKIMDVPAASILDFDVLNETAVLRELLQGHAAVNMIDTILALRERVATAVSTDSDEHRLASAEAEMERQLAEISDTATASDKLTRLARLGDYLKHARDRWRQAKLEGVAALTAEGLEAFAELWALCASVGLFIVPGGELESWLSNAVQAPRTEKNKWVVHALTLMPQLTVLRTADIWGFVDQIHNYISSRPYQ